MNTVGDGGMLTAPNPAQAAKLQPAGFRSVRRRGGGGGGDIVVAVSGLNAIDNPGPGTGVARSLVEAEGLNARVLGLCYDAMEPGVFMDWLYHRTYMMPYPSAEPDELVDRLLHIKRSVGLDCVIPNFDVELPLYIRCADELARLGIHTFLPTREQFRLRNKEVLPAFARQIGVRVPETRSVTSLDGLALAIGELGYPVMVKGPYYKAHQCHTWDEASKHFHELVAEWGYPVIAQRVVIGTELNLVGVGDGEGGHFGLVSVKKLTTTNQGKIWTGVTVAHPGLTAAAGRFLQTSKWRGPFELECMADRDGEVYLIEINPRFPAWTYCATGVGVNLPASLVRAALGQSAPPRLEPAPPPEPAPAGKLFIRYTYEIVTDATPMQALVATGEYAAGERRGGHECGQEGGHEGGHEGGQDCGREGALEGGLKGPLQAGHQPRLKQAQKCG